MKKKVTKHFDAFKIATDSTKCSKVLRYKTYRMNTLSVQFEVMFKIVQNGTLSVQNGSKVFKNGSEPHFEHPVSVPIYEH